MEATKEKEKKETVEVDDAFVDAVADKLKGDLIEEVRKDIKDTIKESIDSITEKTIRKNINGDDEDDDDKEVEGGDAEGDGEESKELKFVKACKAFESGNKEALLEYNKDSIKARRKAGYGNTDTDADGGYLVPDPDFEADVSRMEVEYGAAFANADVRRISSNAVKLNKKESGFDLVETNQAIAKTGVKITIGQVTADLRKFAGIAPATDELTEDAAIDYWKEVTTEFARARAKKADELMFTDSISGLLEITGTEALSVGAANTDLDWDDLLDAEVKVPDMSASRGKWALHRTVWTKLIQTKASTAGSYHFFPNPNKKSTPWGTPVITPEVLPTFASIGADTAFGIFGDLKQFRLYIKNGLALTILKEGTITDSEGSEINLAAQDMTALRGVTRMLGITRHPNAFCIIGTGTVS